jgi:iron complex outermembrane receptor protein
MLNQLRYLMVGMAVLSALVATSARAEGNSQEVAENEGDRRSSVVIGHSLLGLNGEQVTNDNGPVTNPDLEQPATTVDEWMAQIEQSAVQITAVQVNATETGVEIILETDELLEIPSTSVVGNAFIADISNAVLALPEGEEFQQSNPAEGIALVSVTGLPNNRVRVAITGVDAPPTADLSIESSGLVLAVTPGTETAESDEDAIQVVVTGEQEEGYIVDNATTATRTDTPLRDIPQSITVVPRQVIEDQGVTQISDALRNVSGISSQESSLSPSGDAAIIRGFESFDYFFTNGIRNLGAGGAFQQELANVERIEVLRGPASVLYGQGEPGGLINLVTELPTDEPFYEVEGTIGNYDFYRPSIDLSGPLNDSGTIGYRLNAQYQNSGTFVDFVDIERVFVSPVFSFELGRDTSFVLEGSYLRDSRNIYPGLPAVGTVLDNPLGEVPRSRYLGEPDFSDVTYESFNIGYRLEHEFSENLRVCNAFRVEIADVLERDLIGLGALQDDNRTVNRNASTTTGVTETYSLVTDVVGTVSTGNVDHELLFGIDLRRQHESFELFFGGDTIDLFDPVYGNRDFGLERGYDATQVRSYVGIYAQDLISILDNLKLLLGARYDLANQEYIGRLEGESTLFQQDTQLSPRIGVVYQPIPPVSLYASWSRSFFPLGDFGDRNADGTPFEPTTGEQFEVGIKTEFLDGRLAATLAAYEITRQNVLTDDPDRPNFRIQVGEQRSRGIEFDVAGEILPGWNLIASYAYTDSEITEDNSGFEGNRPRNVPQHSGSLWTTYEIQSGDLQGLGVGAGIFVVGDRPGDLANTFDLPSYVRTDAALFYRRDNWQVQLNLKNLFDVDYFESAISRNSVSPGAPFTILGTVSVRF